MPNILHNRGCDFNCFEQQCQSKVALNVSGEDYNSIKYEKEKFSLAISWAKLYYRSEKCSHGKYFNLQ